MWILGVIPFIKLQNNTYQWNSGKKMMQNEKKLDKGDYPENLRVVFCPNKQHSFEPFMCLGLVLKR